jgi:chromosome segregation ATPase
MIADSAEIRFACSQCGQSLLVDSSGAGISLNCPTCDHPVIVPTPGSLHDRHYGESAATAPGRAGYAGESETVSATEAQELREELVEALRRADDFERTLNAARKETAKLQQQLKKTTDENERLTANITAALAEAKSLQTERQQWKADLAQVRQSAATAESQLGDARQKISQIEAALAALEENRAQWEQAFSQTAEGAQASESQLSALAAELEDARAQNAASEQALAEARGETEALGGQRAELRVQLEAAQAEARAAADTRAVLAAVEEKLRAANRAIETVEEDRRSIAIRCTALRLEAETLRHDLTTISAGRELLDLRARFQTTEAEHQRAAAALSRIENEAKTLAATEQKLRAELAEARERGAEAERRAEASSDTALKQDNEVLRGIIARQNTVLEERFVELRRLKRARLFLRILYTFIGLGLVGVAALAVQFLPEQVQHWLTDWFPF